MHHSATTLSEDKDIVEALSTFDKDAIRRHMANKKKPNLDHLPGDRGLPLIGNVLSFARKPQEWLYEQYEKHGEIYMLKIFNVEIVVIVGAEANKLLYLNENQTFSNYLAFGPTIKDLLDDNVLALDFAHHKSTRKTLQAAFKRAAIEGHIELMNPIIKNGIDAWPLDRTVKTTDTIRKLLLDAGAKVFLGVDMGPEADRLNQAFIDLVAGGASFLRIRQLPFMPYAKALKARKVMDEFVYANIQKRRNAGEEGRDIFSQLCNAKDDNGNYFSDEEICNQIIFVLFAAHDTTSSALSSIFYHLASDQEWQEELRQEMVGLNLDHLEFDDFEKMEKTGWTMQEALRMYPPFTFIPRYVLKEFEFKGHKIPAHTTIFGNSFTTHYMPENWDNPKTFDPLRFSPERAEDKRDFYQYTPFGGGAHKCLGLHFAQVQGKMFLFYFLQKYRVEKDPSMKEYNFSVWPLTFPKDGLPLKFTKL
jgi:cytochrome P450